LQGKELPPELTAQMNYAQIERVGQLRTKVLNNDTSGDLFYAAQLNGSLRQEFLNYSKEEMLLAVARCPRAQGALLQKAWLDNHEAQISAQQGKVDRVYAARQGITPSAAWAKSNLVEAQIKRLLPADEVKKLGEDGVNLLVTAIQPGIARQMTAEGVKPDEESVRKYVQRVLNENYRVNGWIWTDTKPLFKLTIDDLPDVGPDDVRKNMIALAKSRIGDGREPTEGEVMQAFIDFMTNPYQQFNARNFTLSQGALESLQSEHKTSTNVSILRRYFVDRIEGRRGPAKPGPSSNRVTTAGEVLPVGGINMSVFTDDPTEGAF
jgi:hypothetical protein